MIEHTDFEIDSSGYFHLKRGNKLIAQYCPRNEKPFNHCGISCPLFFMPEKSPSQNENGKIFYHVHICGDKEFLGEYSNKYDKNENNGQN